MGARNVKSRPGSFARVSRSSVPGAAAFEDGGEVGGVDQAVEAEERGARSEPSARGFAPAGVVVLDAFREATGSSSAARRPSTRCSTCADLHLSHPPLSRRASPISHGSSVTPRPGRRPGCRAGHLATHLVSARDRVLVCRCDPRVRVHRTRLVGPGDHRRLVRNLPPQPEASEASTGAGAQPSAARAGATTGTSEPGRERDTDIVPVAFPVRVPVRPGERPARPRASL